MRIELEEPFKSLWKRGYIRESKIDGRKRIDLVNSQKDRTTISYARYLMSVHIGEIIGNEFEVDHKDDNRTNDVIDNLQILTVAEHLEKTKKLTTTGRTMVDCICAYCKKTFQKEKRLVKKNYTNTFCSRSCNGKFSFYNNQHVADNLQNGSNKNHVSIDTHNTIVECRMKGMSDYKIEKLVNMTRSSIQRYRKDNCIK